MNMLHATVEIGTNSAKLNEKTSDELNITLDIMNIKQATTMKSEVIF